MKEKQLAIFICLVLSLSFISSASFGYNYLPSENLGGNITNYYNVTNQTIINTSANFTNVVFSNETFLNDTYILLEDEGNLNVNSTTWWAGVNGWVNDWLIKVGDELTFNESKFMPYYFNATQAINITGIIDGGTLQNTQHSDAHYDSITFNFSEVAGSPGLDMRINFTGIDTFSQGVIRYKTSSLSGSAPIIQVWNVDLSIWESYPELSSSLIFATITQPVFDWSEHIDGDGTVQMRLYKASNGNTQNHYYIDWLALSKGFGVPAGTEVDPYSFHKNESIDNTGFNITANNFKGNLIGTWNSSSLYVLITDLVSYVGNWSADKVNYLTSTQLNATYGRLGSTNIWSGAENNFTQTLNGNIMSVGVSSLSASPDAYIGIGELSAGKIWNYGGDISFQNFVQDKNLKFGVNDGGVTNFPLYISGSNSVVNTFHLNPAVDDTYDLGGAGIEYRNVYIDGTAYVDAVDNAGNMNIDGNIISDVAGGYQYANDRIKGANTRAGKVIQDISDTNWDFQITAASGLLDGNYRVLDLNGYVPDYATGVFLNAECYDTANTPACTFLYDNGVAASNDLRWYIAVNVASRWVSGAGWVPIYPDTTPTIRYRCTGGMDYLNMRVAGWTY